MTDIDQLCIDTIRTLSIDAVQKANSGHPGAPMGMAAPTYDLWTQYLRYDPKHPQWPNRDRFILSAGHASMLLYSMLHLTKVEAVDHDGRPLNRLAVSMDDVQHFRQPGSATPGHPEYGMTTGVEATTGPLGQGVAMSVGMAIAEKWLAAHYNKPDFNLIDYNVYALCSDGEMMEGIASEAASLAAHLKLDNLCWIYDSNAVTLDGPADLAFSEDVATRFLAYGWNVLHVRDANNLKEVSTAYESFLEEKSRPTMIVVESHIGFGSPHKQDSSKSHGEPLGEDEVRLTKKAYGWPEDAKFLVPDGVYERFADTMGQRGGDLYAQWNQLFTAYKAQYPESGAQIDSILRKEVPEAAYAAIPVFPADAKGLATRESASKAENALAPHYPWLIGGSADLDSSTKTKQTAPEAGSFTAENRSGRNLHFGVREHSMGAICNGLALSGLRPYGATFLIFSDYMRPAIRLSSLMELPSLWVFTHDSIGVGEDGPTHQPVEQIPSLRAIPGLFVVRPGDANEAAEAWKFAIGLKHNPATLILSRQPMPTFDRSVFKPATGVQRGAYVLAEPKNGKTAEVILMGTGSELNLCVEAYEALAKEGIPARVVSMPCWEQFELQDQGYQDEVLPPSISARVAVEQAATMGWEKYTGRLGAVVGMHTFGASAPLTSLLTKFGFTPEKIVEKAKEQIKKQAAAGMKHAAE